MSYIVSLNYPFAVTDKLPDLFWKKNSGPNYQVKQKTLPTKDPERVPLPCAEAARLLQGHSGVRVQVGGQGCALVRMGPETS